MTTDELKLKVAQIIDGACWDARSYGHDDYGLDWPVDINGDEVDGDDDDIPTFHPPVIPAMEMIMALFGKEVEQ